MANNFVIFHNNTTCTFIVETNFRVIMCTNGTYTFRTFFLWSIFIFIV